MTTPVWASPHHIVNADQVAYDTYGIAVRPLPIADSISAFGIPLSQPEIHTTELTFKYGLLDDMVTPSTSGTAYVHAPLGMAIVNVGTGSFSSGTLKSRLASHYTAGTGGRFKFAGFFASGGLDQSTQEIGMGDDMDGLFFGYSGSVFGCNRRNDGTNNWIPQTEWSLDRMDGSGSSRQVLDPTLGNVYMISYQWLGFGAITFFVEDGRSGAFFPVHRMSYANTSRLQSVRDPNLPIWIHAKSWGSTGSVAMNVSSTSLCSEGYPSTQGVRRSHHTSRTAVSNEVPLLSVENTASFNGTVNRSRILLQTVSVASRDNVNPTEVRILINPVLSGSAYVPVLLSQSFARVDNTATSFTGGREIFHVSLGPNGHEIFDITPLQVRLNPSETATMTCSGSNSTFIGSIGWIDEL